MSSGYLKALKSVKIRKSRRESGFIAYSNQQNLKTMNDRMVIFLVCVLCMIYVHTHNT